MKRPDDTLTKSTAGNSTYWLCRASSYFGISADFRTFNFTDSGTTSSCKTLPPIIKTLLKIFVLTIFVSCNHKQVVPNHTDTFKVVDKTTKDTIKFFGFTDIDSAIFYAKRDKQNVLVVFGGYTIEKNWETLKYYDNPDFINSNFKIVWLPVDSRRIAKDTNQVVKFNDKDWRLRTVGDNNYYFQINSFKTSTQPFYCFINPNKNPVGQVISYETNKETITTFINSGLTK